MHKLKKAQGEYFDKRMLTLFFSSRLALVLALHVVSVML